MELSQTDKFQAVVLSALLHDVGKFMQRANKYQCSQTNDEAKENKCGLMERCDGIKHGGDYKHSCHSYWFLNVKEIKEIFPEHQRDTILRLAFRHHEKTDDPLEAIVRIADHFSAGCDRTDRQEVPDHYHYFKRQPMRSIFDKISFVDASTHETYYQINQLEPQKTLPYEQPTEKIDKVKYKAEWEKRWDTLAQQFEIDLKKLKNLNFEKLILALNTTLEQYTWCIPSSTWKNEPDISLYDHLLTSAAFAAAMFRYCEDKFGNNTDKWDVKVINSWHEQAFYFITGDLSGIQEYLFDLRRGKYSAKLLRARSFELQMLLEASIRTILGKCCLPLTCRVMNAAGRFILVLPNTLSTTTALDDARKEIETFCKDRYLGKLNVNISRGFPATGDFLHQKNALDLFFPRIASDVDEAKQHRFQAILNTTDDFFVNNDYERFQSNQDLCPACGKLPVLNATQEESDEEPVCETCGDLIKLGELLPKREYMAWVEDRDMATLKLFGHNHVKLLNNNEKQGFTSFALRKYEPGLPIFYGASYVPTKEELKEIKPGKKKFRPRTKTFEELAAEAEGIDNIAMFKADVDDLGSIFSIGIGTEVSISRFATLSRMVNYFFVAYINDFIRHEKDKKHVNKYKYAESIYTVFSGGDDLCVIGPWDKIISFAEDLQEKFESFVGKNKITVSGGIALASPKIPSNSIFLSTENALRQSKTLPAEKNSLTLFNTTVSWNKFAELMCLANKLEPYIKLAKNAESDRENESGKGLFYRLLFYGDKARALDLNNKAINPRDALWISHFNYDVARNINESKREQFKELCLDNMKEIRIPVSYVLYKNRKRGD